MGVLDDQTYQAIQRYKESRKLNIDDALRQAQETVDASFNEATIENKNHIDYTVEGEKILVTRIANALVKASVR